MVDGGYDEIDMYRSTSSSSIINVGSAWCFTMGFSISLSPLFARQGKGVVGFKSESGRFHAVGSHPLLL